MVRCPFFNLMDLLPFRHELMDAVLFAYSWILRKDGELRQPFLLQLFDVPVVPVLSQSSNTIHSQDGAGSDNEFFGSKTNQDNSEGMQSGPIVTRRIERNNLHIKSLSKQI